MNRAEWPIRLTLAVVIILCAIIFRQWVAVGALGLALLLTTLPLRIEIDRIGEIIVGLVCLGLTYVLTVAIGPAPKHPISEAFALIQAFTCVWVMLYACARMLFKEPWGGYQGTLLFALLGIFACGGNQIGRVYHSFVAIFAVCALWALASSDPSRPGFQRSTRRRKLLMGGALLGAATISVCLFVLLPFLYQKVTREIRFAIMNRSQSGFDTFFRLGSLTQMIQSRRVVLRVNGPRRMALHLRGLVYDRYYNKHWRVPHHNPVSMVKVARQDQRGQRNASRWNVRYVAGENTRYFVPLHSARLATPDGRVRVSSMGIIQPLPEQSPDSISFTLRTPLSLPITKPRRNDLQIPTKFRHILHGLAKRWTQGHPDALQKMLRLTAKLKQDYRYSLSFGRSKDIDPLLDFLLRNKQGHCEYFASALALLARSVGVPTRMIGGYLVSEYNTLGQYFIVREQNAHAWVEAWIPGRGWRTFDPTPASGVLSHMPDESTTAAGLLDLLRVWFGAFRNRMANLTLVEILSLIGFFVVVWVGLRLFRYLRTRRQAEATTELAYRDPMPAFAAMLQALQSMLAKTQSESLESYASRLQQEELPQAAHLAAPIVIAYASYRYGQIGDPEELAARMEQWLVEHGGGEVGA